MLSLYRNIRKLREENGWSQEELAKKAGYKNRSAIARIENGDIDLPQSKIATFAKIFGLSPADLMGADGCTDDISCGKLKADEQSLVGKYRKLNSIGRSKLHDRADELIQLGYTHEDPELIAAHDEGATPEEREAALKLMRDDSKW